MPSVLLPEAVGPTIAMTGDSEDTQQYHSPENGEQQKPAGNLIT